MRGLWKVAFLAPALVKADWKVGDLRDQDIASKTINVPLPDSYGSPDAFTTLSFHIDVLTSDYLCGYSNLTVNGQELTQEPSEVALIGSGPIDVNGHVVEGSWSFSCLYGCYGPYAQRLDFFIVSVDGQAVEDVGFWLEFKQNDNCRIFSTSAIDDTSTPSDSYSDSEISTFEDNALFDDPIDAEHYDIERELAELQWMKDVVRDLKSQIHAKEEAMVMYLSQENFNACNSVKCLIRAVFNKARMVAYKVIGKIYLTLGGDLASEQNKGPPWKKPHGNSSHGNHTCPGKGNHTHPPVHHKPPPSLPQAPPQKVPSKPLGSSSDSQSGLSDGKLHDSLSPPPSLWGYQDQSFNGPPEDYQPVDRPKFAWKLSLTTLALILFAGAIFLILLIALIHRRCCCSAARRQDKQTRREERRRRRDFRRAANRQAWRSWFARRILYFTSNDDLEDKEKRAALEGRSTEVDSDTIASEIGEFRNAVSIVSDMIAAEEGRVEGRISMESRGTTLPEYMSDAGGERLPTYEVEERSELSSVVADGFLYIPGTSQYTPGNSESGSVRDVLGVMKE